MTESSDATWHEWPLTATDGDCATLLQLVSENKVRVLEIIFRLGADFGNHLYKVDFKIDTSLPRAARAALDWNSKKAGVFLYYKQTKIHCDLTNQMTIKLKQRLMSVTVVLQKVRKSSLTILRHHCRPRFLSLLVTLLHLPLTLKMIMALLLTETLHVAEERFFLD